MVPQLAFYHYKHTYIPPGFTLTYPALSDPDLRPIVITDFKTSNEIQMLLRN